MEEVAGTVLVGESFDPVSGRVVVEDGRIAAIEEVDTDSTDIVLPALVNAHTHLGDSVAKEAGVGLSLDEAVAPPNSLKHRRLAAADREELVTGERRTPRVMNRTGAAQALHLREPRAPGARAPRGAGEAPPARPVAVGPAPARLGAGPAVAREPAGPDVEQGRGETAGGEPDGEAQDDPSRNPEPEHLVQHEGR
mgnify:CR=1 FL=1